ncbi:hypothetical protein ABT282_10460 [Streptomyces sp. NPDC000927]|uniref:hypothetical protein n=1 Tax=Streptomyces sp. NPDC000927 TaxID=3154371 RepID=UPI003316C0F2
MDSSVAQAISNETGQQQPFSPEVLQSITYLHISYAHTLDDLAFCHNLEVLQIMGCDPVDLNQLNGLSKLASLVIKCSALKDLSGVENLPSLLRFVAGMNRIEDLSPLLQCPELARLDIQGNPLSEHSYRTLAPQLQSKGIRVTVSDEPVWQMNLELQRHGFPFSFYKAHDGTRLCRPGLALTDLPDRSHPIVALEDLSALLSRDPEEVPKLFDRLDLMPTTFGP